MQTKGVEAQARGRHFHTAQGRRRRVARPGKGDRQNAERANALRPSSARTSPPARIPDAANPGNAFSRLPCPVSYAPISVGSTMGAAPGPASEQNAAGACNCTLCQRACSCRRAACAGATLLCFPASCQVARGRLPATICMLQPAVGETTQQCLGTACGSRSLQVG